MEEKKLSYEELEKYAAQMSAQIQQLYAKLQELNMGNAFKRLDYLFKVLENSSKLNAEFVEKCAEEIQIMMTLVEKEEEEDKD